MGIKNLNELIKRYAPEAMFTMPIEDMAGKKIAIDGNGWLYANLAIVRKKIINKTDVTINEPDPVEIRKELLNVLINFVINLLINGIESIFVFDGKDTPIEKGDVKEKRQEKRDNGRSKIDECYLKIKSDPLMNNAKIVEELRKELRNYLSITSDDFDAVKMLLKSIGIPCFQAKGDGEKLCSSFCVEEQVAAVFSVDTDNLVYGCPLLITGYSTTFTYDVHGNRIPNFDCVRVDKVLQGLGLDYKTFIDLCIMCGCDFNKNIPKYAAIKSYDLLKKCGSIDNLPKNLDISCLNHQRCREIFSFSFSKDIIENYDDTMNLEINKGAIKTCRDYMDVIGMSIHINKFVNLYNNCVPCTPGLITNLQLTNVVDKYPEKPRAKRLVLNILPKSI